MSESQSSRSGEKARDSSKDLIPRRAGRLSGRWAPDAVAFKETLSILRRHIWLILAVVGCSVGAAAFLAFRDPSVYRATATVRYSEGLRDLTADINEVPAPLPHRTIDPVLSLSEHLKTRQVVGSVVDSLGTRLRSLSVDFPLSSLKQVQVDRGAPPDTLRLHFTDREVVARAGTQTVQAPYGRVLRLGGVAFAVTTRPDASVRDATLSVARRETEIDRILSGIEVVERAGTDVIDVSYTATDPTMAHQVVNSVVKTFQAVNIRLAQEQSRARRIFLLAQLRQTDSLLASAQTKLAAFRSRQQLANSSERLAAAQSGLVALDVQREQLLAERRTFGELPLLLASPNDSVSSHALRSLAYSPEMASNPAVSRLTQQLIDNQTKLDSLTYGSAPTNPDLAQLRAAVRSTKQELLGAVASQIRSLDARINAVATLRQRSGTSMQTLPALEVQEMRLQAHVEALSTVGDRLRQESQKAHLAEAAEVGDMQIMDLAGEPYSSTWPAGWLKIGLGLLAGLLLGGGGAFLLEMNDTSIRRPEELEEELQIAGIAIIPRVPAADKNGHVRSPRFLGAGKNGNGGSRPPGWQSGSRLGARGQSADSTQRVPPSLRGLVTLSQPQSIGTEAFRMLRTNLIWSDWGKSLKTIVITSVAPGEGKTLTAANLAVIFASGGMRVLMVDGDLRRARLHKIFRMPRGPGLTELIKSYGGAREAVSSDDAALPVMNGDELRSQIRKTALDGLYLLPAGVRSRSSEAFGEAQVRSLLRELSDVFDLVVIDAPPVLASADAAILASMADGVLLVVRAGRTGRGAIQHAYQQLIKVGARVVGTVLNDPQGVLKEVEEFYYPYLYPEVKD